MLISLYQTKKVGFMKFSAKSRYGIKAMCVLASQYGKENLSASEIAERTAVTVPYMEKILRTLKNGGFVSSNRGTRGGYYLCYPPEYITIGQILKTLDEDMFTCECLSNKCINPSCPNREIFGVIYDSINQALNNLTFSDMIKNNQTHDLKCNID